MQQEKFGVVSSKSGGSYYYETSRESSSLGDGRVDCAIPDYPPATVQIEAFDDVSSKNGTILIPWLPLDGKVYEKNY